MFAILFLIIFICFTLGNQEENVTRTEYEHLSDDINDKIEFWEFCQSADLIISPITDLSMNTLTISFGLLNEKFKDCFFFYNIMIERKRRTVSAVKVMYNYDLDKKMSYTFNNITCGIYEVVIQPCYNSWQCAPLKLKYPKPINMSSIDCFNNFNLTEDKQMSEDVIKTDIIILAAVISVVLTFISGLVYYYYWTYFRHRHNNANRSFFEKRTEESKSDEEHVLIKNIHIFIFHYYDRNENVKRKAKIFRDFLMKSSFYRSVRLIESELVNIIHNPFDWLHKTLEEETDDGSIVKIIIIDSMEDVELEESEIENSIFTHAIDTLGNNLSRSLADYDNLFVVRLDGNQAHSRRIANFVRGHRYLLSNSQHVIELCVNLCSGSGLDTDEVQQKIKKLYLKHEVRNL